MICVDNLQRYPNRPHGHEWWAHLYDDDDDVEALHRLADQIGLKRQWYQNDGRFLPHYDVTPSKHRAAIQAGATLVDQGTFRQHCVAAFERWKAARS